MQALISSRIPRLQALTPQPTNDACLNDLISKLKQLDFIGQFSLAIFGWQHLITATNWTASVYSQLNQAAIVKSRHPDLPVYVYTGFGNADGYNAATWPIIKGASDGCPGHQPCRKVPEPYTDWVLETDHTPVYSMSACEQVSLKAHRQCMPVGTPPQFKRDAKIGRASRLK